MNKCPFCQGELTADSIADGICWLCQAELPDLVELVHEDDSSSPPQAGSQTIDDSSSPPRAGSQTIDDSSSPPQAGSQTIDDDAFTGDDDESSYRTDHRRSAGSPLQTIADDVLPPVAAELSRQPESPADSTHDSDVFGELPPANQTIVEADLEQFTAGQTPPSSDHSRIGQTIDSTQLPADWDSDALEENEPKPASPTAGNYNQTIDSSQLPANWDSDAMEVDEPQPAAPATGSYNQTIDASQLPAAFDSDAMEVNELKPASPTAGNYNQTIDSSLLPTASDSKSFDLDGQTLDETGSGQPRPGQRTVTDRPITQTIDASFQPVVDPGSYDVDDAPQSAPTAIGQTIDASQLPISVDTDSVNVDSPAPGSGNLNQTIDSSQAPLGPVPGPAQTIDSVDLPVDTEKKKDGTVSDRRMAQTLDSTEIPAAPPTGTVAERRLNQTVDSVNLGSSDDGTMKSRQLAQTYDSSVVGSSQAEDLRDVWGAGVEAASPHMTIKGNETHIKPGRSTLVIQRRAFQDVAAKARFGDADYDLVKMLGQGGMGVVYAARQASIDRTVAIKMLKPNMTKDESQRNKFLTEAVITGDLDHPNIVPIYDLGANDEGALFYAMKCVKGTPWDNCIKKQSLTENLEVLLKVCDAVAFAHSRGIIHRDLKPENTMIGDFGEVLVMDWGLALPFGKYEKSRSISPSASMGGTPAYMAPEMATGPFDKMTPLSDVYLLGAILYEAITGNPPHRGKDVMKCLFAAAKNEITPTDKRGELVEIALKAMATKPADRYASVTEFQAAIRGYQEHSESIAMSTRAEELLDEAKQTNRYETYANALFGFEEAYKLWNGNKRAARGASRARLAYAAAALNKGDFDLADSLLDPQDPEHQSLSVQIAAAIREREVKHQRLQTFRRAIIGMAASIFVLVSTGLIVVSYSWRQTDLAREKAVEQEQIAVAQKAEAERQEGIAQEQKSEAQRQEAIAKEQKSEAERQRTEADRQRGIAVENEMIAQQKKKEAEVAQANEAKQRQVAEYEAYVALIGLAAARIEENAFEDARNLLNSDVCKPQLRGWEWRRLMYLCSQTKQELELGAGVEAVAYAPNGEQFAAAGGQSDVLLFDARTGNVLHRLPHGDGVMVQSVAYSPDGQIVATGSNRPNAYVRLWNAHTGEPIGAPLAGHTGRVLRVKFARQGPWLVSTSQDHTARVWDVSNPQAPVESRVLRGHSWWVWDADFSPDANAAFIVTASNDGTAIVWNRETGERLPPFTGHRGAVYAAAFTPDGESIVSGGFDKRVLVWNRQSLQAFDYSKLVAGEQPPPQPYQALAGHGASVRSVATIVSDGKPLVASAGHDNTIILWDLKTLTSLQRLRGHGSWVRGVAFAPEGKQILSGGYDTQHQVRVWDIAGYEERRVLQGRVLEGHEDAVLAVTFSRAGDRIATASRDRSAKSWSLGTGRELMSFVEGHGFLATSGGFLPDGARLFTAAVDNTTRVWNLANGNELLKLSGTGRSAAAAASHDGRWILTGSDAHTAKLWNAQDGSLRHELGKAGDDPRLGHKVEVSAVAFTPDDRYCFSGDANGRGMIWEVASGQPVQRLEWHSSKIAAARFLRDGRTLLTASDDRTVCRWDVSTLGSAAVQVTPHGENLPSHPNSIWSMDLSADERLLTTTCADGVVRVWDLAANQMVRELKFAPESVNDADIADDGLTLLTVHPEARAVRKWHLASGHEITAPDAAGGSGPMLDLSKSGGLVWTAFFAPGNDRIVTVGGNEARLWEIAVETERPRELMSFQPHAAVAAVAFSPDGKRLVTGGWDFSARVWDAASGKNLLTLQGQHTGYVNSAAFAPDGATVLTASDDQTAVIWDLRTGQPARVLQGHAGPVRMAIFSADGRLVLTASQDNTSRIWNAATGEVEHVLNGPPANVQGVLSIAISLDGTLVATGNTDSSAQIWDAAAGTLLRSLNGHTAGVTSVAFSPEGNRVLTSSEDFTAKLWDAHTATEILNLKGHSESVTSASFSYDGRYALTGSRDGTAILWLAADLQPANPTP